MEACGILLGEEGTECDEEADVTCGDDDTPLLSFENGLDPLDRKAEGALAYLLFLSFLVDEDGREEEVEAVDFGEARPSSLCRFF